MHCEYLESNSVTAKVADVAASSKQSRSWKPTQFSLRPRSAEEKKIEETLSNEPLIPFNQENLLKVWSECAEKFKVQNGLLGAISTKYSPICASDSLIEFRIREKNEVDILLNNREYLLKKFLERLECDDLELEIILDSNAEIKLTREFMSDDDLYDDIRKQNPPLKNWLDELGV